MKGNNRRLKKITCKGTAYYICSADNKPAASSVHFIISCKHSLVLLRMGEIISRNMLS